MRKIFKTFLCCVLTIALVFSDLSIFAYAEETTELSESMEVLSKSEEATDEPEILYEMTEKRDETTKYFAMSDGGSKAFIYPQNVHYLADGNYEEIDNTLVEIKENGKIYYKNKKNDFSVKLPEGFTDDYIEFEDENGFVRFKLKGATNKKIEKLEKEKNSKKKKDITVVENVNDRAIYKSVKGNVDVEYDIEGNKLKETIVLYKKTKNTFIFDVQTSAASAKLNEDNSISFYDKNDEELYVMASPYMVDDAGEYSNGVEVKFKKSDNGYTLTYKPNYEWLSAKEREYPVRIDPTLFKAVDRNTVTDTYVTNVQSASDAQSYGKTDVINIGRRATNIGGGSQLTLRGFIRFDIPSEIGKNDCILDAQLYLTHYNDSSYVSVNGTQIDVHELKASFSEDTTWWGNQPSYDSIITDYAIVNTSNVFSGTSFSYDSYNLTKLVNKWHNGGTNYGIALKLHDEGTTVSSSKQVYYLAKQSRYFSDVSKFVEITYRNATGLEDYWSYTTQDFGEYGTGYVNNYNGNLVYVHEDTSFNSLINGFTLAHVYNSNMAGTGMGYYGSGWRLNLVQKLEPITVTGNSSVKYVYTDGDGTRHYFIQNSDGKIVDEDGLGYTYEDISEGELIRKFTDKNGTVYKFDLWGYLRHIIDSHGNVIVLHYSPIPNVDNYLSSITTSSGASYQLIYDSNYNLVSICDNNSRTTSFEYTNENLSKINYPDGTSLKFEYCSAIAGVSSSSHWLHDIISPDGRQLRYWNYPENGKIYATRYTGLNNNFSPFLYLYYSQNQTRILDYNNRNIYYQFDTFGRATCVYDDKQNIYSQTYNSNISNGSGIFKNNKLASASNGEVYVNNILSNGVFSNGLSDWVQYKDNTNAQISVVSNEGLLTSKSIKINNAEDNISVIYQTPSVTSGGKYTLSGYIKTENVESVTHGAGLEVIIRGINEDKWYYSDFLIGTTNTEIDNGFQRISITFELKEGEYIERITAGLYNASGTIYIDCLQLEEGNSANQINLVDNSSFERNSGNLTSPIGFAINLGSEGNNGVATEASRSGSKSCKINGVGTQPRSINQVISTAGKAGDEYTVGSWAKANAVPNHHANAVYNHDFTLHVFAYNNGVETNHFIIPFNEYVTEWQFVSQTFILTKDYTNIKIYCSYDYNCNTVYFDNLFLYRDTMQSYTYDSKGNVISTSDYASQNETFQYDNNNYLSKLISPTGSSYEYLYDSKNNMNYARSGEGLGYEIEYDSQGNSVATRISSHAYSSSIQSGKVYYIRLKHDGQYLTVENAGTTNSTNVKEAPFCGGNHQKWRIEETTDGYYIILPQHVSNMALDIAGAENLNNTNVQIYAKNNTNAQRFKILPQSDYAYKITPECSGDGKILTVNHASSIDNVTILSPQGSNNADQEWIFESVEHPHVSEIENGVVYQFRSRCSGKYLDLTAGYTDVGTIVQQYECNYTAAQKFILNKYQNTEYYTIASYKNTDRLLQISDDINSAGYNYLQVSDNTITQKNYLG